jgi:O-antigen/teichoic acid export membrane protein
MLGLTGYIYKLKQLHLVRIDRQKFDAELLRDMGRYAFFILLGTIGGTIVYKIDSILLNYYVGEADTGIFRITGFIGLVVEMPRRALSQIAAPVVAQAMQRNDLSLVANLYRSISTHQYLAGAFLLCGIWCNIDNIFALMPRGDVYAQGKYVVLLVGISKIFDMVTSINEEIIAYSPYYRYTTLLMVGLILVTIGSNMLFIPIWGIVGAALASAICILSYNIFKFMLIYSKMNLQPFSISTIKITLIATLVAIIGTYLPPTLFPSPFIDLICRSLLIGILFAALTLSWRVSDEVNKLANKIWKRH